MSGVSRPCSSIVFYCRLLTDDDFVGVVFGHVLQHHLYHSSLDIEPFTHHEDLDIHTHTRNAWYFQIVKNTQLLVLLRIRQLY